MRVLVAAIDFSSRSDLVLQRAAILALSLDARLILLHAVDPQQPAENVAHEIEKATIRLRDDALRLAEIANASPEVVVTAGDSFRAIVSVGTERGAELVIMGAHRRRTARDLFIHTTAARVLRAGCVPVLLVNRPSIDAYRRVLVATDLSPASAHAAQRAESLGLLNDAEVSLVHAFKRYHNGAVAYSGVNKNGIIVRFERSAQDALTEVVSFFHREGLNLLRYHILVEEGDPLPVILRATEHRNSELLVVGTRRYGGLKRILLGAIAGEVLRQVDCDVLAVPPDAPLSDSAHSPSSLTSAAANSPAAAPASPQHHSFGSGNVSCIAADRHPKPKEP